jgi:hypothetical protein
VFQPKKKKKASQSTFQQKLTAFRDSVRATLGRQTDDVWGLVLVVISILVTLAFVGRAGPIGDGMESGSTFLFGVWRFALPVALLGIGIALIIGKPREGARRLVVGGLTTFIGTLALFHRSHNDSNNCPRAFSRDRRYVEICPPDGPFIVQGQAF